MDLQVETLDTHEARLTITVPDDVVTRTRRDVARRLSKSVRIPGFRPGNAPINVIVAAVGGDQVFAAEVAEELASRLYADALDESKIEPYGPGQLEDFKSNPTQLVIRVPLEPVVDLKDYKSIRLPVPTLTATDEEVETQLQYIREDNAIVELVDRPAEMGDLVDATVVGTADGEEVLRNRRPLILDDQRISLPGLVEAIVGMQAGEHKDFTQHMPEDADQENLRGKDLVVSIDVTRVSSRTLPEISDELAQAVGQFETLADLREDLRKRILAAKQRQADQEYAAQTIDAFTNLSTVVYPPVFLDERMQDFLKEYKEDVLREEGMPFEDWLRVQGKTEEQVREELQPMAEMRAKRGLVMRDVARAEGVKVVDAEVAYEVERQVRRMGGESSRVRRSLMTEENQRAVQNNILSNKVIDRMVRIARGEADQPLAEQAASVAEAGEEPAEPESAATEPAISQDDLTSN